MNYQKICEDTRTLVLEAGTFIREQLGKVGQQSVEEKSINQLVSYVDRKAEELLVAGLRKIVPEATFVTEEQTVENQQSELQWIIDPLDGTTNFLYNLPIFSVSVALQKGNEIVVGVVYEINRQECFYAWQGGGAWLNEVAIRVSKTQTLEQSLVATGFPVDSFGRLAPHLKAVGYFIQHTRGLRRLGSAATDLAYVACGRFDVYFEYNLNAWDVAAGVLLVHEAGGAVTDFSGGDNYLFGREVVAANRSVHGLALPVIRQAFYPTMPSV